jgi:hypothetical protein
MSLALAIAGLRSDARRTRSRRSDQETARAQLRPMLSKRDISVKRFTTDIPCFVR